MKNVSIISFHSFYDYSYKTFLMATRDYIIIPFVGLVSKALRFATPFHITLYHPRGIVAVDGKQLVDESEVDRLKRQLLVTLQTIEGINQQIELIEAEKKAYWENQLLQLQGIRVPFRRITATRDGVYDEAIQELRNFERAFVEVVNQTRCRLEQMKSK